MLRYTTHHTANEPSPTDAEEALFIKHVLQNLGMLENLPGSLGYCGDGDKELAVEEQVPNLSLDQFRESIREITIENYHDNQVWLRIEHYSPPYDWAYGSSDEYVAFYTVPENYSSPQAYIKDIAGRAAPNTNPPPRPS